MSADYNNFSLNKGKFGKIDLTNLKGGLKREQIKDKNLLAIFDALDDGNRVLDSKEINNLQETLKKFAKNTNLSKKEAEKYLKTLFGNKKDLSVTNEDLFKFLNDLNTNSSNIKNSGVQNENGQKVIQTEYKDGTIEKYSPADGKRVIIKDNKTSTYNKDGNLVTEEYFDRSGNTVKTFYENGKPAKTVTGYKDGSGGETVLYDEEGNPESKTVKKGAVTENYEYTENGARLTGKTEIGATPEQTKVTNFNYNEDGTVTETVTQGNVTTETTTRNGEVLSSKSREQNGETTVETTVDENGNATETTLNKDGGKVKQVKTVNGETYTVEYDGNGNTYVTVQNGESIEMLAKHFGVDPEDIKEINKDKIKGSGNNKYFLVGEKVRVPKELEADDPALKNRNSAEEETAEYAEQVEARRRAQQEEEQRLQDEVKSRKAITFTSGQKTFEELAKQLYKQEGVENPSERQLELRIEELKKQNSDIKDGELQGKRVTAGVAQNIYDRVVRREGEVAEMNRKIKANEDAGKIAGQLYDVCDDNAAAINRDAFWDVLNQVDENNVIQVLDNYDKVIQEHPGDSSLIDTICSEFGASAKNRKKALTHILDKTIEAARAAGVSEADLEKARTDFMDSMQDEFAAVRAINPTNMEKAIDFLRGAAVGAKLADDAPEVSTQEAIDTFINGSEVKDENGEVKQEGGLVDFDAEAQQTYTEAREAEGWVAKTGDWVCGLFGCTTIDDMDEKLAQNADDVKKLAAAAESGNEAEFKALYKQIFGIEFNPKIVAARETAKENYEMAATFDSSYKAFDTLEEKIQNMDYAGIRSEIKSSFNFKDEEIDDLISAFAEQKGLDTESDADKKYVLNEFIKDSKKRYFEEYQKLSNGKTLEQMGKDLDLLTKAAYGTNDIVKDVIQFNENQQMTEMVTSAALEIGGTIALQFVPGLGQMAAAKLAVSAAKWGSKGIKLANMAKKAQTAAGALMKAQETSNKVKIVTQTVNAGVATAAVNLSNKKSVEETLKKTLMNMAFAGAGTSSNVLAPKLMKTFGIANKAIANELAEEIMNLASSYGITKISGSDYTTQDGFFDLASGLVMARLSHVKFKSNKPAAEAVSAQPPKATENNSAAAPAPQPENNHSATKPGEEAPVAAPEHVNTENIPGGTSAADVETDELPTVKDIGADAPEVEESITVEHVQKGDIIVTDDVDENIPGGTSAADVETDELPIVKDIITVEHVQDGDIIVTDDVDEDIPYVKDISEADESDDVYVIHPDEHTSTSKNKPVTDEKSVVFVDIDEDIPPANDAPLHSNTESNKLKTNPAVDNNTKTQSPKNTQDNNNNIETNKPETSSKTGENTSPSTQKPQIIKVLGQDMPIAQVVTNKNNTKTLTTMDGSKILLDAKDRPVSIKSHKSGDTTTFEYANPNDTEPSKITVRDKMNKLKETIEKKGDSKVVKDYAEGKEYLLNKNGNTISEKFMELAEYPVTAKIPSPETYSANMKQQIQDCTTLDKLNDLKIEYSMYNSQYGKTEDLFVMFSAKDAQLNSQLKTAPKTQKPHKPYSKLITSTNFDNALQNLNLKKFGLKGIPLKYSHESFMKDLNNALEKLPADQRDAVMKNFNIKLITTSGKVELSDIPDLSAPVHSQAEKEIQELLTKYTKHNEMLIADPALKAELENFIKDVPEFTFTIGKPQNGLHSYSLDSHTLQNLQKALKYADEANLSDDSKQILKMSILLHDMGKQFKGKAVSDTGHAILSKQYASKILERFDYPQETKNRILNLIENHHWFKDFNKGNISADDVMQMFGDDLPLAKVMAKADLESVSDDFHLSILEPGKKLTPAEYEAKINEKMDSILPVVEAKFIGRELPIGQLSSYKPYILDYSKADVLMLGNNVELNLNDPTFKQLCADLKEGESFAVGCINPKTNYNDVKYKIGTYEEGVGSHHLIVTKKYGEIVIEAHKDVSVVKSIPTAKNSNPVIAKKIDELRSKATSITTKTFNVNGKQVAFEVLNGTQGGSNKGYYVINKATGDLFYAKFGGSQGKTELLANKLYEMAGVKVPEMASFTTQDGVGTLSKYVPDLTNVTNATSKANDGFGMDVLLANWDVVGANYDNMLKTSDGTIIRLDAGGTFDYRAQGKNKPYTSIPTEIITLLDPSINPKSAEIFSHMDRSDIMSSLQKVVNLKDSEMTQLLENMGLTQYKEPLLKRKKFLKTMLEEMKNIPRGNLPMLEYMQRINNNTMAKFIDTAKTKGDLEDISLALQYVKNPQVKADLQSRINVKLNEIQKYAPAPKLLSEIQVVNLLQKNGFAKNYKGELLLPLGNDDKNQLVKRYGSSQATYIIKKLETPLSASDIKNIQMVINQSASFVNVNQLDPQRLVLLYQALKQGASGVFDHNAKYMTPAKWAAIVNIAKEKPITAAQLDAFYEYKGSSSEINGALSNLAAHKPVSPATKAQIDAIQSYINTQKLPETVTMYRTEGYFGHGNPYGCLGSVKLTNGQTLDQALEAAVKNGPAAIKAFEKAINIDGVRYTATNERFTSASLAPATPTKGGGRIVWELSVQKGSKAAFLEGNNFTGTLSGECEMLLQKDSKFVITGIKWDDNLKKWKVKAKVVN